MKAPVLLLAPALGLLLGLAAAQPAAAVESTATVEPDRPSPPDVVASGRVEVLPDADGRSRLRVAHGLRLGAQLAPRLRLDLNAAARFGGSLGLSRAVELSRLALSYRGHSLRLVAGRLVEPSTAGRLLLDGVLVDIGPADSDVSVVGWLGHSWHPEIRWEASRELAGGAELLLRPRGPLGRRAGVDITVGGSLRGDGGLPEGRLWAGALGRGARSQRWAARIEGRLPQAAGERPALRVSVDARSPIDRRLELGAELRWEGLPRLGVPVAVPTPMELLAPGGYGIAQGVARLRLAPIDVRLEAGPTVRPQPHGGALVGGIGRVAVSAELPGEARLGWMVLGGGIGNSWAAGGGASVRARRGPVEGELEGTVLRMSGISGPTRWLGEARARVALWIVPRRPSPLALRVRGELGGGSDRLLALYVRGGLGLEFSASPKNGPRR